MTGSLEIIFQEIISFWKDSEMQEILIYQFSDFYLLTHSVWEKWKRQEGEMQSMPCHTCM